MQPQCLVSLLWWLLMMNDDDYFNNDKSEAVVTHVIICSNMMVSVLQKICIVVHVPVDGNIWEGLEQVRGAAIEKSGS